MTKKHTGCTRDKAVRVAAYIRVSSAQHANDRDSLPAQKNEIEHEIEYRCRRHEWTVAHKEFYVDVGEGARNQNRPQLQRLMQDIEKGVFDVVICSKLDRLARKVNDFVSLWELFARHNVDVISLRQRFDTSIPAGRAMLGIIRVFARLEGDMMQESKGAE